MQIFYRLITGDIVEAWIKLTFILRIINSYLRFSAVSDEHSKTR